MKRLVYILPLFSISWLNALSLTTIDDVQNAEPLAIPAIVVFKSPENAKKLTRALTTTNADLKKALTAIHTQELSIKNLYAAYTDKDKAVMNTANSSYRAFISNAQAFRIHIAAQSGLAQAQAVKTYVDRLTTLMHDQMAQFESQLARTTTTRAERSPTTLLTRFIGFFKNQPPAPLPPALHQSMPVRSTLDFPLFDLIIQETNYLYTIVNAESTREIKDAIDALQDDCYAARIRLAQKIESALSLRAHDVYEYARWALNNIPDGISLHEYNQTIQKIQNTVYQEFLYCVYLAHFGLGCLPSYNNLVENFFKPTLEIEGTNQRTAIYRRMKSGKQVLRTHIPLSLRSQSSQQDRFTYEFFVYKLERSWYNSYALILSHLKRAAQGLQELIESQDAQLTAKASFFDRRIAQAERARNAQKTLTQVLKDPAQRPISPQEFMTLMYDLNPPTSFVQQQEMINMYMNNLMFHKNLSIEENKKRLIDFIEKEKLVARINTTLSTINQLKKSATQLRTLVANPGKTDARTHASSREKLESITYKIVQKEDELHKIQILYSYIQKRLAQPETRFPYTTKAADGTTIQITEDSLRAVINDLFIPQETLLAREKYESLYAAFTSTDTAKKEHALNHLRSYALKNTESLEKDMKHIKSMLAQLKNSLEILQVSGSIGVSLIEEFIRMYPMKDPSSSQDNLAREQLKKQIESLASAKTHIGNTIGKYSSRPPAYNPELHAIKASQETSIPTPPSVDYQYQVTPSAPPPAYNPEYTPETFSPDTETKEDATKAPTGLYAPPANSFHVFPESAPPLINDVTK